MSLAADKTHQSIMDLANKREERRRQAEELKRRRASEARDLQERGKFGDSDFVSMIERYRAGSTLVRNPRPYVAGEGKINVAVRKRPCSEREQAAQDHDSVTCANPFVVVHHCKLKVDGITKMLENTQFEFDYAFHENATNDEVYDATCLPLVQFVALEDGRSTVFAYGQTGSGKTFTMQGLQNRVARDIFRLARTRANQDTYVRIKCANFELYGVQCLDLLNDRRVCAVREDGNGEIHIDGLREEEAADEDDFLEILQRGMAVRTTRSTEMNADSSRSHAIFQVSLSTGGKLSLIDLAGSERGQDSKNHDATRRVESAHINKSLLALKECIRALDPASGATHVPYRGSKLTMVLKDSFAEHSRTVMISCVSPAASSSDHTLNTLRYADRVKAKGGQHREQTNTVVMTNAKSPGPVRKSLGVARQSSVGGGSTMTSTVAAAGSKSIAPPAVVKPQQQQQQMAAPAVPKQSQQSQHDPKRGRYPMSPRTSALAMNLSSVSLNKSGVGLDTSGLSASSKAHSNYGHGDDSFASHRLDDDDLYHNDEDDGNDMDHHMQEEEEENHLPARSKGVAPVRGQTAGAPVTWNKKPEIRAPSQISSLPSQQPPPPQQQRNSHQQQQQQHQPSSSTTVVAPVSPMVPVSVYALVDEEEALLDAYSQAVQQNFRLITEESNLLTEIESVVDYDIEEYTERLRVLLEQKLQIFTDLHSRLLIFQNNLRLEEQFAMGTLKRA